MSWGAEVDFVVDEGVRFQLRAGREVWVAGSGCGVREGVISDEGWGACEGTGVREVTEACERARMRMRTWGDVTYQEENVKRCACVCVSARVGVASTTILFTPVPPSSPCYLP